MADYAIVDRATGVITGLTTERNHARIAPTEMLTRRPLRRSPDLAAGPWVLLPDDQSVRKATRGEFLASDEDAREEFERD